MIWKLCVQGIILLTIWNLTAAGGSGRGGGGRKKYFYYETFSTRTERDEAVVLRLKRSEDGGGSDYENEDAIWLPPQTDEAAILESVDIPEESFNETLKSHSENNVTLDNHRYYTSQVIHSDDFWVDLNALNKTHKGIVKEHSMLSKSYRHAATIALNFSFPFYGHFVKNITIATGGFLYTGEYVHSWLAATQYIAPLMANFDTSQHETAKIRYADNGTALIVEWNDVYLKSGSNSSSDSKEEGPFTFQVIIHDNGNIVFAYKTIPIIITTIEDKVHPVKVGLSDAYIIDRTIFFVRRKTIYEYHRVNLKEALIANSSAIYFTALPTCNSQKDCHSCLSMPSDEFECAWCPELERCSDGMDRYRQAWLQHNCDKFNIATTSECDLKVSTHRHFDGDDESEADTTYIHESGGRDDNDDHHENHESHHEDEQVDKGAVKQEPSNVHAHVAGIIVVCVLFFLLAGWVCFAYYYPHSWSGQMLIKYRPTRWHWRRGEARYTAASIHM